MGNDGSVPHGIRLVRSAPALRPFVRYYAQREARLLDTAVVHAVHARAAPILEFNFADPVVYVPCDGAHSFNSARTVVVGIQTRRRGQLQLSGTVNSFAILFQPAGLGLLFGSQAEEFTNRNFDGESVFGPMISRFHERLADCCSFEERISAANQFLLGRVLKACSRDGVTAACEVILRGAGGASMEEVADRAGLSVRQFRRRFIQEVGIGPKLLSRIVRFEAALDRMGRSPDGLWTETAHELGYYDQMHMIHEFAEFTGETPTRALKSFEAAFQRQMAGIKVASSPRSDGDRWIL
jgi:AraC-like DNA-binding protein